MVRRIFFAAAVAAMLLAGVVSLGAQPLLNCFISDPDVKGLTNIRDKPGGKVLFQVRGDIPTTVTVAVQPGGWWRIVNPEEAFGDDHKIPSGGVWIHRSVLAVATDNFDGHDRMLMMEPRADAPRMGFIGQFNAVLRPLEMTADGNVAPGRSVWGAEPQLVQVSPVGKPDVVGWVELFHLSAAPAPALTYADVAGTYESYNEDETIDSRLVLTQEGYIRWSYGEQTDYLEYPFIIRGNGIYQDMNEVDAQTRPSYIFDPETRNLLSYGTVYHRKK